MQCNDLKEIGLEWKSLEALEASGHLSLIDLELAKLLLGVSGDADSAALICHLALAARRGHLCIEVFKGKIAPTVISLWSENRSSTKEKGAMNEEISEELFHQIEVAIVQAAEKLPESLLTTLSPSELDFQMAKIETPLCRMGNRLYFQRYWYYETIFLHHYRRFSSGPPEKILSKELIAKKMRESAAAKALMPEQKDAILNACTNALTIICGGPGTGKTHTAGVLICTLWDSLSEDEREKFEISLAAPTGKAAANLQKSLLKSAKGIEKLSTLQAKTLHALLGFRSSTSIEEVHPLSADLVIVDESSMIDVRLMAGLFAAMKPGARLVLLGDEHQLAAVEAGSIFADFVHAHACFSSKEHLIPNFQVSKLHKCLRSELQGILDVAAAINRGDADAALHLFDQADTTGIQRLKVNQAQTDPAIAKELAHYAFNCFQLNKLDKDPIHLLNHFNHFRILSPLRKGPYGVEEINRLINNAYLHSLGKHGSSLYVAPIMLLKNDYRLELFNGEVGVLVKPHYQYGQSDFELSSGDYALFPGKEGEVRQIPALLLPTFEHAYCLSVHKSQGSEFDHLLLLLPSGSEHFGRELLYTGVTRARRQLTVWGEDEVLRKAIQLKNRRLSGITERLTGQIP